MKIETSVAELKIALNFKGVIHTFPFFFFFFFLLVYLFFLIS
jgi:hypothetical protein